MRPSSATIVESGDFAPCPTIRTSPNGLTAQSHGFNGLACLPQINEFDNKYDIN